MSSSLEEVDKAEEEMDPDINTNSAMVSESEDQTQNEELIIYELYWTEGRGGVCCRVYADFMLRASFIEPRGV